MGLCPLVYFRDNPAMEHTAFHLHMNWEKGILPAPGALDDQAAHYSAAITATEIGISSGRSRKQEVQMKQAERPNQGKGGRRGAPRRKAR